MRARSSSILEADLSADHHWIERGSEKVLGYVGPRLPRDLTPAEARAVMRRTGAWALLWDFDHDYASDGPWYVCICDDDEYGIESVHSSNARHNVRRGLDRCDIQRIDFGQLAVDGYETYRSATTRYDGVSTTSRGAFEREVLRFAKHRAAEAWAAFVGEAIAAFMTVIVHREGAFAHTAHFDPRHTRAYPMYALYFRTAGHYLRERGLSEFSRGTRPLLHRTSIDDFLLRLGFRRSYCRLGMHVNSPLATALHIARSVGGMRRLLFPRRIDRAVDALLRAREIAEADR